MLAQNGPIAFLGFRVVLFLPVECRFQAAGVDGIVLQRESLPQGGCRVIQAIFPQGGLGLLDMVPVGGGPFQAAPLVLIVLAVFQRLVKPGHGFTMAALTHQRLPQPAEKCLAIRQAAHGLAQCLLRLGQTALFQQLQPPLAGFPRRIGQQPPPLGGHPLGFGQQGAHALIFRVHAQVAAVVGNAVGVFIHAKQRPANHGMHLPFQSGLVQQGVELIQQSRVARVLPQLQGNPFQSHAFVGGIALAQVIQPIQSRLKAAVGIGQPVVVFQRDIRFRQLPGKELPVQLQGRLQATGTGQKPCLLQGHALGFQGGDPGPGLLQGRMFGRHYGDQFLQPLFGLFEILFLDRQTHAHGQRPRMVGLDARQFIQAVACQIQPMA